jgi:hypothetical protein
MVLNSRNIDVCQLQVVAPLARIASGIWVLRFPSNIQWQILIQMNFLQLFNIPCEQCSPIFSTPDLA